MTPKKVINQNCLYKHVSYYKWQGRYKPIWVPTVWYRSPPPPPTSPWAPNSHLGPQIAKDLNGFTYDKYIIHFPSYYTYVSSVMRSSWHFGNPAWIQHPGWCAHGRPMKMYLCAQEHINPWAQAQINPWSQVLIDPWAQTHIDPWVRSQIKPGGIWAQVQIDPWAQVIMIHEYRCWLAFEPCNTLIYIKCIGIGKWLSLFLIIL